MIICVPPKFNPLLSFFVCNYVTIVLRVQPREREREREREMTEKAEIRHACWVNWTNFVARVHQRTRVFVKLNMSTHVYKRTFQSSAGTQTQCLAFAVVSCATCSTLQLGAYKEQFLHEVDICNTLSNQTKIMCNLLLFMMCLSNNNKKLYLLVLH